jgi:hypothetical protein
MHHRLFGRMPTKKLDNLRGKMLSTIEWLNVRAGRSVEHFVRSDLAAGQSRHCEILRIRADLAKDAAFSMIRQSLSSLAQLCHQIPRYYANVDSDKTRKKKSSHSSNSLQKYMHQISANTDNEYLFTSAEDIIREPSRPRPSSANAGNTKSKSKSMPYLNLVSPHRQESVLKPDVAAVDYVDDGAYGEDFIEDVAYGEDFVQDADDDVGGNEQNHVNDDYALEFENVVECIDSIHDQYCDEFEDTAVEPITDVGTTSPLSSPVEANHKYRSPNFEENRDEDVASARNRHRRTLLPATKLTPKGIFEDLEVDTSAYLRGLKAEQRTVKGREIKLNAWNPVPCRQCRQTFKGPGFFTQSMSDAVI